VAASPDGDRPDGVTCWGPGPLANAVWWGFALLFGVLGVVLIASARGSADHVVGIAFLLVPSPLVLFALRRRRLWLIGDDIVVRGVVGTRRVRRTDVERIVPGRSRLVLVRRGGRSVSAGVAPTDDLLVKLLR